VRTASRLVHRWTVAAAAACFAETVTFPLDVAKIRMQLEGEAASGDKSFQRTGMVATMVSVVREEGLRGLYSGVEAAALRQVVYGGIGVGLYAPVRKLLIGSEDAHDAPLWKRILAGMITGGLGQAVASPTDVVKVRVQADGRLKLRGGTPRYAGTWDAFKRILLEEGVRGYFVGFKPSVVRAAVINGCGIASYDHSKQFTVELTGQEEGLFARVVASLISGLVSALVSTPVDVVKTRLMNQPPGSTVYRGMIDCAIKTFREEGIRGTYSGFVPTYTRLAPWQLVFFVTFDALNKAIFGRAL
jgi:hypothetical protein